MEKIYLSEETRYLTNHGFKYITDIDDKDELILISNIDGEITLSSKFEIIEKTFKEGIMNSKNNYSELLSNIEIKNIYNNLNIIQELNDEDIKNQTFYINDDYYGESVKISLDKVILLSIIISNNFKEVDDYVISKSNISKQYIFWLLSRYSNKYNIYFPYNKNLSHYEFKTNLYKDIEALDRLMLSKLNLFKNVLSSMDELQIVKKFTFKAFWFDNFSNASIFQVLTSLCGYHTKLIYDDEHKTFKVTYVKNDEKTFKDRDRLIKKNFKQPKSMYHITLHDNIGKLIVQQTNNNISTISIFDADSTFFSEENS